MPSKEELTATINTVADEIRSLKAAMAPTEQVYAYSSFMLLSQQGNIILQLASALQEFTSFHTYAAQNYCTLFSI
jgi:hypothetical protein